MEQQLASCFSAEFQLSLPPPPPPPTAPALPPPPQNDSKTSLNSAASISQFLRPFYKYVIGFLFILIVVSFVGSALPMDRGTAVSLDNGLQSQIGTPSAYSIWANNFQIAALGLIPGFGLYFSTVVSYNTGQAFNAIGVVSHIPGVSLYLSTMLTPYFWLEYFCYTITPIVGLIPIVGAFYHKFKLGMLIFIITFFAVAAILYLSAVIEMLYISGVA